MKLIIERNRWLRGEGSEVSSLLRSSDNKMCCLGFFALSLGATKDEIRDVSGPGDPNDTVRWPAWLQQEPPLEDTEFLPPVNDDVNIPDIERENRIAELFAEHGVEVEFV